MLERVAVHQTRLRVPGVGLDARGVVLGSRGLVLLPSLDRLVTFLGLYTEEQGLEALLTSLRIEVVRSQLGAREVVLGFDAGSSDRLDRIAEVGRLAGAHVFTGTSRHFVQYRDAAAPFGYDAESILSENTDLVLYHNRFTQAYEVEREIVLDQLLLRMEPYAEPGALEEAAGGEYWVLADEGLGSQLVAYLRRSGVGARAGVAEWPPESSLDDTPLRRWLLHVPDLPPRMLGLVTRTPGLVAFTPEAPGVVVEVGFRHPVTLRACPVFPERGLVLFRGQRREPLRLERLPQLGDIRNFTRVSLRPDDLSKTGRGKKTPDVALALRLVPGSHLPSAMEATLVPPEELQLLRRLAYHLGSRVLAETRIAVTRLGAFLLCAGSVEAVPLGTFFRRLHRQVFVPLGQEVSPRVSPAILFEALGSPPEKLLFFLRDGNVVGVDESAFQPLEDALASGADWAPIDAQELDGVLDLELPQLWNEGLGSLPLSRAKAAPDEESSG